MIQPHGGKLINRVLPEKNRNRYLKDYRKMPSIKINLETIEDIHNIARGVFSPLEGYMLEEDVFSVITKDRLPNNLPWTIPITLDVKEEIAKKFSNGDEIALVNEVNQLEGILHLEQKFSNNKKAIAQSVFQTQDSAHPGVAKVMNSQNIFLGGKIDLINTSVEQYKEYTLYPADTRQLFQEKGWKTIAGFQTRNIPHLGHEYVQKSALTLVDGLFVNPIIGEKKKDDFLDPVIIGSYEVLMKNYYKKERSTMVILRTRMRYAGPKEAIHHAIMRKNFGCTHFIVGRDHAGVGTYYGPFDAHKIFEKFPDMDIKPIFFGNFYNCLKCGGVVNDKICPHEGTEFAKNISGTKIRQMILAKELKGLTEFLRPEVAEYLIKQEKLLVE